MTPDMVDDVRRTLRKKGASEEIMRGLRSSPLAQHDIEDKQPGGIAADRLRSIVERIERLEEERKALASDIKDVFTEAKSAGFDVKVIRRVLRDRKLDPADLEGQETLLDLYRRALGM